MSAELPERSSAVRFLDAFLQEQNIKWILGLGLMILLGSSTMLVTNHWQDYTPLWKSLILFGYTFSIHLCGQISYHSLQLRKTGTGLMALTVLLIPLDFLALRWIHPQESLTWAGLFGHAGHLALLGGLCVCSTLAARRILLHFLRKPQTTFLISYLVLCFSGTIVPSAPASWALPLMLILWSVFAAGSMKVNRHIFWLTEEHRFPRIFGFFPILLLGTQFFTIYAIGLAQHLSIAWLGLGLVLTAIPVLLAVDVLTDVIQKRHPDLTGPYPASIAIALFCGLTLTLAGVIVSGTGYPQVTVLVPTAALAACMMLITGRRTNKVGLIWMAILFAMTAYQTSPVFFKDVAIAVRNQGAATIHEDRLPLAFYGLTYLPLVAACSLLSWWRARRGDQLLAVPLRQFSIGLPLLLLPLSLTHAKAIFPVGIALAAHFAWQLWLTRDRRILVAAVIALLSATAGFPTFFATVLPHLAMKELPLLAGIATTLLLLIPGRQIDRWASRLQSEAGASSTFAPCQLASLMMCFATSLSWFKFPADPIVATGIALLLTICWLSHVMIWRLSLLSHIALIVPLLLSFSLTQRWHWSADQQLILAAMVTAGFSMLSRLLPRVPTWNIAQVFQIPCRTMAIGGVILVPLVLKYCVLTGSVGWMSTAVWTVSVLTLLTGIELAWRLQSRGLTVLGWFSLLDLSATMTMAAAVTAPLNISIVFVWAAICSVGVGMLLRLTSHGTENRQAYLANPVLSTLEGCVLWTQFAIVTLSPLGTFYQTRLAGGLAVIANLILTSRRPSQSMWNASLVLANGFILTEAMRWSTEAWSLQFPLQASQLLPIACTAALSTLFWNREEKRLPLFAKIAVYSLEAMAFLAIFQRDKFQQIPLSFSEVGLLIGAIGLMVTLHVVKALKLTASCETGITPEQRRRGEDHVRGAELLIAFGCLQLAWFGILPLNGELALFVPLILVVISWSISRWSRSTDMYTVFDEPLRHTALLLPAVTTVLCLYRHITVAQPEWQGMNSLALLLAGGFYFWQGLERQKPAYQFAAAGILNLATSLLWLELKWSDPQLFLIPLGLSILGLVELLRAQIPGQLHTPLSYAGALTILVSPTFHIVDGSWLHLISLMIISVLVVLLAMGLRVRALMFTGTAFLVADLISMVVRGSYDNPSVLWLAGIAVGTSVVALAAYCERHREQMLQQIRFLAARMESWR